jgi:putative endonuclease
MAAKHMFPYIMANKNNHSVLYTGITNNLIRRVQEHKTGIVKGFTQKYHLHNLCLLRNC